MKISAVINTWNEEDNIVDCIESIRSLVDEIVVVDMMSSDRTRELAEMHGARIFEHEQVGFVEPARNYALGQAVGDWILLIDADERMTNSLAHVLREIVEDDQVDYVRVARKNMIFNKWIQHSGWWPDYNVRFFKKGAVSWQNEIHSQPKAVGNEKQLPATEQQALIHYHYRTVSEYVQRLDRYTKPQAKDLQTSGYRFAWQDLIIKPTNEFLRRYFAEKGYEDGLHGFVLASLQALSEFVLYLKVWEAEGFEDMHIEVRQVEAEVRTSIKDYLWWIGKYSIDTGHKIKQKIFSKLL